MPLQDVAAGQVGRDRRREALAHEQLDRVLLQRQLQQHGVVLQEVEAVAGDAGAAFEIDQVVLLGQLRRGRARESRTAGRRRCRGEAPCWRPRRRRARRGASGSASRRGSRRPRPRAGRCSACIGVLLLAQPAAFVLAGFALGVVLGLADRSCSPRSPAAIELLDLGLQLAALRSRARRTGRRRPSRRGGRSSA